MSKSPAEIEESIQLAIDAAAAANDSAEDVTKMKSATKAAADRLDALGRTMKPLMIGTVIGAVAAVGLAGAIYTRTLSDLRVSTAAQLEALALFSQSVIDLQARMVVFEDMDETLAALADGRDIDEDLIRAAMGGELAKFQERQEARETDGTGPLPQMLRSIAEKTEQEHADTRDLMAAAASDLQLALTRVIADRLAPSTRGSTAATTSAPATPAPVAQPAPRPRPQPARRAAAPQPAPNPFSFP